MINNYNDSKLTEELPAHFIITIVFFRVKPKNGKFRFKCF